MAGSPAASRCAASRARSICRTAPSGEPGRRAEPPFEGALRDVGTAPRSTSATSGSRTTAPGPDEVVDQGLGVVGARRLPARPVEPESPPRRVGQLHSAVDQRRAGQVPQRGADRELDADEGRAFRHRRGAGRGLGAGDPRVGPPLVSQNTSPHRTPATDVISVTWSLVQVHTVSTHGESDRREVNRSLMRAVSRSRSGTLDGVRWRRIRRHEEIVPDYVHGLVSLRSPGAAGSVAAAGVRGDGKDPSFR